MKTEVDKDIWRQTHSGVEQFGNSLSADNYPRAMKMEASEKEDRHALGSSKVAAPSQLTTTPEWRKWRQMKKKTDVLWGWAKWQLPFSWRLPQSDENGGRWRKRQMCSGVEQSGSSLSADDYPRVTKMEADEEEDRCALGLSKVAAPFQPTTTPEWRKWRQMKKKTDALWGLAKWQLRFSLQLPQSDEDRTWYLTSHATPDSRAHGGCSSLCSPRSHIH